MRNPPKFGTVKKLSGNRRRPYVAIPFAPVEEGKDKVAKRTKNDIKFLKDIISPETYAKVEEEYLDQDVIPTVRQKVKPIGYFATRKEALIALAEYNKSPFDLDKASTTFEDIYKCLTEEKYNDMKKQAKSARTSSFDKFAALHNAKIREINLNMMQNVIDKNSDLSKSTQRNMITLCHDVFEYALKHDIVEKDYSQFLEVTSKKESSKKAAYSKNEIKLVWDNLEYTTIVEGARSDNAIDGLQLMDTVIFLLYTVVRISELLAIECEDVHTKERYIHVKGTKTANAERFVPIHKELIPLIEKRLKTGGKWLVTTRQGKQMSYIQYLKFYEQMCREIGIDHTIHECRHTFATFSGECDMDKTMRAFIMGHSLQNITDDVYTDVSKLIPRLVREIDKYDPVNA